MRSNDTSSHVCEQFEDWKNAEPIRNHGDTGICDPVISICIITYNQELYIADTLDGILNQETKFPVEILIHDDASTDNTTAIIKSYQDSYPHLIHAIFQTKNQHSRGEKPGWNIRAMSRGQFVAFCEGDDYWTHNNKLQIQVEYLRSHPEVVLSFHDVLSVNRDGELLAESKIKAVTGGGQLTFLNDHESIAHALIPTLSIVYRNLPLSIGHCGKMIKNGDNYLFAMLARYGAMHDIGVTMGAHRSHAGGVWSSTEKADRVYEQLKTQAAIAYEIQENDAHSASYILAKTSCDVCFRSIKQADIRGASITTGYYLFSVYCSFRYLFGSRLEMSSWVITFLKILWRPMHCLHSRLIQNV